MDHECEECNRSFETARGLSTHRTYVHDRDSSSKTCPECGGTFQGDHGLTIHLSRSHNIDRTGETTECGQCGTEITRTRHEIEEYEHNFCSDECESKWRSRRYAGEQNPIANRVDVQCKNCGKEESVAAYREETYSFCSYDCKAQWQTENRSGEDAFAWEGGMETIVCEQCGDTREVYPAVADQARFCSYECLGQWRSENQTGEANPSWEGGKETIICENCGDERLVDAAVVEEARFCSPECLDEWRSEHKTGEANPNWRGGYEPYYGASWRSKRSETLARDRYRCWFCGLQKETHKAIFGSGLSVHHVRRFSTFEESEKANRLWNLLSVCRFCHKRIFHS